MLTTISDASVGAMVGFNLTVGALLVEPGGPGDGFLVGVLGEDTSSTELLLDAGVTLLLTVDDELTEEEVVVV